jgi:hypothetical protein
MPLVYDITVQLPCFEADVAVGAGPVPLDPPEEPPDPLEEPEEVEVPDEPDVPDDPLVPLLLVPELVPPPSSPLPLLVPLLEPMPDELTPLEDALPELAPPEPFPPFEPPFDEPPPKVDVVGEVLLQASPPTARPSKQGTKTFAALGSLDARNDHFDMTFPLSCGGSDRLNASVSREGPSRNVTAVSCWLNVVIPWHHMVTARP